MANFDLFDPDAQMKNRSAASAKKNNRGGLDNPEPIKIKHHQEEAEKNLEMVENAYREMNSSNEREEASPEKSNNQEALMKDVPEESENQETPAQKEPQEGFVEQEFPAEELPKEPVKEPVQAVPPAKPQKSEDEIISDIINSFKALIPNREPQQPLQKEEDKPEPSESKKEPEVMQSVKRFKRLGTKKEEPKTVITLSEGTQTLVFAVGEYEISAKIEIIKK